MTEESLGKLLRASICIQPAVCECDECLNSDFLKRMQHRLCACIYFVRRRWVIMISSGKCPA